MSEQKPKMNFFLSKSPITDVSNNMHEKYDNDHIPPDWGLARNHLLAGRLGEPEELSEGQKKRGQFNFCLCCGKNMNIKEFALCINNTNLGQLGAGYPLLFIYIKYCILILFSVSLISGAYDLYSNLHGNDCQTFEFVFNERAQNFPQETRAQTLQATIATIAKSDFCMGGGLLSMTLANKRHNNKELVIQAWLNLFAILILFVIFQFLRYELRHMDDVCDDQSIDPTDYTIIIKNIPVIGALIDYDDELFKVFSNHGTVKKVNLCFDLDEFQEIEERKKKIIEKKQKFLLEIKKSEEQQQTNQISRTMDSFAKQIQHEDDKMEELKNEFVSGQTQKFCGVAFVSFDTEQQKENVIEHAKLTFFQNMKRFFELKHIGAKNEGIQFMGNRVKIEEAPLPTDIIFKNQGLSTMNKFLRRLCSNLTALLFLAFIFVALMHIEDYNSQIKVMNLEQKYAHFQSNSNIQASDQEFNTLVQSIKKDVLKEILFPFNIVSLTIVIANFIIKRVIKSLQNFEKHSVHSGQNKSNAIHTINAQFINTSLMLFVINYVLKDDLLGAEGLLSNAFTLFFTTTIMLTLENGLLYPQLYQQFKRWKESKKGNESVLTQQEAQKLYQNAPFEIAEQYANIVSLMYFTAFYAPVIPIGIIITLLFLCVYYWLLKFNLLRRSRVKNQVNSTLTWEMVEMTEHFCTIYCLSNFVFCYILNNNNSSIFSHQSIVSLIGVFCGVLHAILPMQKVNRYFFQTKPKISNIMNYEEASMTKFHNDYDIINPATSEPALKALIIKKKQYQLQSAFKEHLK